MRWWSSNPSDAPPRTKFFQVSHAFAKIRARATPGRQLIKLECTGCQRQFRLKPVEGRALPEQVVCPRCGTAIEVPREDLGWEKRDISRVFGRDEIEPPRSDTGGHAPTPEKKSRVFRDVTQVNPTPVSRADRDAADEEKGGVAAPPTEDTEEPADTSASLGARLRELKEKRLKVPAIDEVSEASESPADTSLSAELEAIVDEAASALDEASDTEQAPAEPSADEAPGDAVEVEGPGGPEPTPPPVPTPTPEPTAPTVEPPYTVRVDDEVHDELSLDAVAELVRSGVWTEVVEVQTTRGDWIRLSNSSVMTELRDHLAEQAKSTLELVASGEWERQPLEPGPDDARATSDSEEHEHQLAGEPDDPAAPSDSTSGAGSTILVAMGFLFAVAAGIGLYQWYLAQSEPAPETTTSDESSSPSAATDGEVAKPEDPFAAARAQVERAHDPAMMIEGLADEGHHKAARQLAIDIWATGRDAPGLQEAFNRAIEDDPALHPEVVTLGKDVDIDRVFALGGGRSISFRLTNDGQTRYSFKPEQKEWKRGWRAELAAYLFCEVVVCQFEIPRNQPAKISREEFERLYGLVETYRQSRYAERFGDLDWRTETSPEGQEREYLYGVLEAWVPGFVDWPVEYTSIWADWLDVRYHPGVLDEPLVEELAPLQDKEQSSAYSDILSERGEATTRDIASQLSSMLLFDFLTSNWDRFSDVEAYYGVNNQFAGGHFISIDLGAAFYDERINKVASRFDMVTRFSARTVASVRALEPHVLNPVLFPDPTSRETYRLALFWTQHDEAIQRIDALIEKYGRERVLEFR